MNDAHQWFRNARRYAPWAAKRGTSVWADGKPRENERTPHTILQKVSQ